MTIRGSTKDFRLDLNYTPWVIFFVPFGISLVVKLTRAARSRLPCRYLI
jgi:hypothetical protein